jgi:predicted P-loop ATPase/GTPase
MKILLVLVLLTISIKAVQYDQGEAFLFNNAGNILETDTTANRFLTFSIPYNKAFQTVPDVAMTYTALKILNKSATKRGFILDILSKTLKVLSHLIILRVLQSK